MPLYVADYLGDTQHLSTEEHGAYLLLLMALWRVGGTLPNDDVKLARIVRLSKAKWLRLKPSLMDLFDIGPDEISHGRVTSELQKAGEISQKRSAAGKAGVEAKALKNNKPASANAKAGLKHSISDHRDTSSNEDVAPQAKSTPRSELELVLDPERADAVLDHRQRIRSPLTPRAAKLLAGKLAQWPGGANEAADAMIEAGWRGFEPEWLEHRKVPARGHSPPKTTLSDLARKPLHEVFQ